jgi:hypothetical protein
MIDVGTLGGTFGGPEWVNNRGQVIGESNLAGDLGSGLLCKCRPPIAERLHGCASEGTNFQEGTK